MSNLNTEHLNKEGSSQLDKTVLNIINDPEFLSFLTRINLVKNNKPFQWFFKRIMDFTFSIAGIIILSPVLAILVIAIKIDSRGSAIFKQKRVGIDGKVFNMYKFRSMVHDAENKYETLRNLNQTNPVMFKMFDDPRVTRIGRFIRKYSMDELPQLLNVIKGEMSLVGPRPPLLHELEKYKARHYVRFATLPGLTGIWQVSGRSNIQDFDEVVNLDYAYIAKWNLWLDIKLILKTFPVVLSGRDAA